MRANGNVSTKDWFDLKLKTIISIPIILGLIWKPVPMMIALSFTVFNVWWLFINRQRLLYFISSDEICVHLYSTLIFYLFAFGFKFTEL